MSRYDAITEVNKNIDHIEHVEKFNPYHDAFGRFSSPGIASSFTLRTRDPKKQHMADMAIAREKSREEGKQKIKTAESRLKNMLPEGSKIYLGGCDPEVATSVADTVEIALNKYPKAKDAIKGIITNSAKIDTESSAMAAYDSSNQQIYLNTKYYGSKKFFEEAVTRSIEQKYHPEGTDYKSVLMHEIGHALDSYVSIQVIGMQKVVWQQDTISTRLWNNEVKAAKKAGTPLKVKDITNALSRYAATQPAEYFAEGFSEFMCSASPRPAAMKVGKRFESYYKKMGGD